MIFLWFPRHDRVEGVQYRRHAQKPFYWLRLAVLEPLFSLLCFERPYPRWLYNWLLISYSLLFIGQIRAWWIPYLLRAEPERVARFQVMFGNTHAFLPQRNGLVPNTAHVLLHLSTAATLTVLLK